MMSGGECLVVTCQTFSPVVCRLLRSCGLRMRIMTTAAPHLLPGFPLALTQRKRLKLAEGLWLLPLRFGQHEVMHVVGKPLSWLKVIEMLPRLFYGGRSFEMTLHANRVAPPRRQLRRIYDHSLAVCMFLAVTMTTLAGNSRVKKWLAREFAVAARLRSLHAAGVAIQATGKCRQIQWDLPRIDVCRSHIPAPFLGIPVDGSFEKELLIREKVSAAFDSGPDEIQQFALAADRVSPPPIVTHPHAPVLLVNAIVHSGILVVVLARDQPIRGRTAGACHDGLLVRTAELGMAAGASLVSLWVLRRLKKDALRNGINHNRQEGDRGHAYDRGKHRR